MATLRMLKKDIDYLVEEVITDCLLTAQFHPEKTDEVTTLVKDVVQLRNEWIERANNPVEKNNNSLVRKHYQQLRRDIFTGIDQTFEKLSALNK